MYKFLTNPTRKSNPLRIFSIFHRLMYNFAKTQEKDAHNSTHIKLDSAPQPAQFKKYLQELLSKQVASKSKAVWLHLEKDSLGLIPIAIECDFKIHHGLGSKVSLYKWLSEHSDLVPPYSQFYVACGGIIIHDGKVLMVQEANGNRKDSWGVPGGLSNLNEPISDAVAREVREETSLNSKYRYIVYFRELENTFFGGTDFYFACLLDLEEGEVEKIKLDERELKAYEWVPLADIEPFVKSHKVYGTQLNLLTYLSELYKKNYNFHKQMPNVTNNLTSTIKGVEKYYKEHRFIHL